LRCPAIFLKRLLWKKEAVQCQLSPVKVLFENLEAGMSIEEVIEQFPVTREQLDSLMAFVARSLEKSPSYE
jgi:uncharacterized protein (DUF433 family)